MYRAAVWQNNIEVAAAEGKNPADVEREVQHYAMMYAKDGPVAIRRNRALARWINADNG